MMDDIMEWVVGAFIVLLILGAIAGLGWGFTASFTTRTSLSTRLSGTVLTVTPFSSRLSRGKTTVLMPEDICDTYRMTGY